jgi:hypothetical protein
MGFFGLLFWIGLIWLVLKVWRSYAGCAGGFRHPGRDLRSAETADQQSYIIDALESRVAELEERLDFTERLVAGRREAAG